MKCPICKKTISDNLLKCPHCNVRVGLRCKNCNTVNSIQNLNCTKCGQELLKICPNCKSVNLPNSKNCRKCGAYFNNEQPQPMIYEAKKYSQKEAVKTLVKGIQSPEKKIFSISGEKGSGKSEILKRAIKSLNSERILWLFGKCTPLTQLTPGGLIQDIILNMFELPNFCANTPEFKKNAMTFFKTEFPEMDQKDIDLLLNFLYSTKFGKFEDIQANKTRTFNMLYKVFNKISTLGNFIIIADNFDFIDGFSYEFINNLFKNKTHNMKLIMMYCEAKPASSFIFYDTENATLDISLAPLNPSEMKEFCKTLEEDFSYTNDAEKKEIIAKSKGNPAFLEQALSLCFDCQFSEKTFVLPDTFTDITKQRLKNLKEFNPIAFKTLVAASIIGNKINCNLLKEIFSFNDKDFSGVIEYLTKMQFIKPLNEGFYEFKNLLLWETILTNSKKNKDFIEANKQIATSLQSLVLNSNAILGIIAQNLKQTEEALDIWTKNTKLAAYLGDVNLYVISQKQCLALINELDDKTTLNTRYNIYERLGKILSEYNPKEAMEYLPDAINNAKISGNNIKEIELLGYLSQCCIKTNNYFGNIECVNNVLAKTDNQKKLHIALLKTTKLKSLTAIGNYGEVINTIENDILPILDEYLSHPIKTQFSYQFIYNTWVNSYLILANALIRQGNDRSFEILTIIFDIIERDKIKDADFICKSKLALAFANTIKGDFSTSESILNEILEIYQSKNLKDENIIEWNLIKTINKILNKRYDGLQENLFNAVTFANNCQNEYMKNILKTFLGKMFKDNNQSKEALEIYNGQITYFAKEKMATGALLTWYLIAEATLDTEGPHAAIDIAQQAIDVAKNPNIYNYYLIVLLKYVIAKSCIVISDYETAKINLDSAITQAIKFNMQDLLSRLYLLYGKYFQEIGLVKTPQQQQYLCAAKEMFKRVTEIMNYTKNKHIHLENEKAKKTLNSFCKLNEIKI